MHTVFSKVNKKNVVCKYFENLPDRFAIGAALGLNLLLLLGTLRRIPLLYLPWMLFYGLELFGGWSISLAFLLLPGKYGLKI